MNRKTVSLCILAILMASLSGFSKTALCSYYISNEYSMTEESHNHYYQISAVKATKTHPDQRYFIFRVPESATMTGFAVCWTTDAGTNIPIIVYKLTSGSSISYVGTGGTYNYAYNSSLYYRNFTFTTPLYLDTSGSYNNLFMVDVGNIGAVGYQARDNSLGLDTANFGYSVSGVPHNVTTYDQRVLFEPHFDFLSQDYVNMFANLTFTNRTRIDWIPPPYGIQSTYIDYVSMSYTITYWTYANQYVNYLNRPGLQNCYIAALESGSNITVEDKPITRVMNTYNSTSDNIMMLSFRSGVCYNAKYMYPLENLMFPQTLADWVVGCNLTWGSNYVSYYQIVQDVSEYGFILSLLTISIVVVVGYWISSKTGMNPISVILLSSLIATDGFMFYICLVANMLYHIIKLRGVFAK